MQFFWIFFFGPNYVQRDSVHKYCTGRQPCLKLQISNPVFQFRYLFASFIWALWSRAFLWFLVIPIPVIPYRYSSSPCTAFGWSTVLPLRPTRYRYIVRYRYSSSLVLPYRRGGPVLVLQCCGSVLICWIWIWFLIIFCPLFKDIFWNSCKVNDKMVCILLCTGTGKLKKKLWTVCVPPFFCVRRRFCIQHDVENSLTRCQLWFQLYLWVSHLSHLILQQ